jgi:hypothetical protein
MVELLLTDSPPPPSIPSLSKGTPLERGKLKKEIIAQNNRHIAIEAHRL